MTKLFYMIALPLIAFCTILIGLSTGAERAEQTRRFIELERQAEERKSSWVEGKLHLISEIERNPYYKEVIR